MQALQASARLRPMPGAAAEAATRAAFDADFVGRSAELAMLRDRSHLAALAEKRLGMHEPGKGQVVELR